MRLHVLASGSKGNCSVVENCATGALVVIDCGISKRAFMEGCSACGLDPVHVEAVLVTHEHSDHVKGLGVLTRGLARLGVQPSLYASAAVHNASPDICAIQDAVDLRHFKAGDDLPIGGMVVHAFATSHDAAESFGFRFDAEGEALGFMTDTGIVTGEAYEALQRCQTLAIEANHDVDMLAKGPYPYYLKARVGGERGHLSNDQSAELLESLLCDELQQVIGMHVSQNNNTYSLPPQTLANILERNDHPAQALVGYQSRIVSVG
ncbi:MAG: MBL fold metallo-hydrolase [Eggerthellaceae bacterium]|nr:MBL fold metallo-hydrolase [Eggerthellaceae bacterium]